MTQPRDPARTPSAPKQTKTADPARRSHPSQGPVAAREWDVAHAAALRALLTQSPSCSAEAALRCDGLTAPWVVDGAMDRAAFNAYVETQLAPTLRPGDVVIADNLSVHKSARAATALKARGAWFLFLPQYSPDLNPIEMAFAKIKALLRKAATRTFEALWAALGDICALFSPDECWNFFKEAGYASS